MSVFVMLECTFEFLASLPPGSSTTSLLSIDFNETTQPAQFDLCTSARKFPISITAPVGELLKANTLNEKEFLTLQSKCFLVSARFTRFFCIYLISFEMFLKC